MFPGKAIENAAVALERHHGRFRPPQPDEESRQAKTSFETTRQLLRDEVIGWAERFQISVEEGMLISCGLPFCRGVVDGVVRDIYLRAHVVGMGDGDSNAFLEFFTAVPELSFDDPGVGGMMTLDGSIIPVIKSGRPESVRAGSVDRLSDSEKLELWAEMFDMLVSLERLKTLYPADVLIKRLVEGLSAEADDPVLPAPRYFDDFVSEATEA